MKKRIVMIGTSFDTQGGISSVVKVYRAAGLLSRLQVRYLETHRDGGRARKLGYFARAWLQFLGLLLSFQIGVLHVHLSTYASFWRKLCFILPAYLFRIPVIIHLHGGAFARFYDGCSPRRQALIRYVYDKAACVIALSNTWVEWLRSISKNPHLVAVYNPVQVPPLSPFAEREPASVLFLGRIAQTKGAFDLIQACARLRPKYPQLKLILAGDGDERGARKMGDELGLGAQLEVPGWVNGEQKQQLLRRACIFALPSHFEGLPMSLLEAMAIGLPVITTPVGGIPEAVTPGCEGYLLPPQDVDALTATLDTLLADAALRQQIGSAGRDKVQRIFSTEQILPQLERIYAGLGVI